HVHSGSGLGDSPSGQLQTSQRKADFQNGPAAPSFRSAGMEGIEDHRAFLDRRPCVGFVCIDDAEIEVRKTLTRWGGGAEGKQFEGVRALVVGMKRSGVASAELLTRFGAVVSATDLKPLAELGESAGVVERL